MVKRLIKILPMMVGLAVFALAAVVLQRQMRGFDWAEAMAYLQGLSGRAVTLAFALTALNYLIFTIYDMLAARYAGATLTYRRTALAGGIGFALGNGVGMSSLASSSVRYRFYAGWGLSPLQIVKLLAGCWLVMWSGYLTLAGGVLAMRPPAMAEGSGLGPEMLRTVGLTLLGAVVVLAGVICLWRRPLRLRGRTVAPPSPGMFGAMLLTGMADWLTVGTVLYVLLPEGHAVSYWTLLGIYLLAAIAGMLSQAPAGLGVLESVVMLGLAGSLPTGEIVGTLLVFRAIYYLLPALAGLAAMAVYEGWPGRHAPKRRQLAAGNRG